MPNKYKLKIAIIREGLIFKIEIPNSGEVRITAGQAYKRSYQSCNNKS